jgi:hypothetical protein
MYRTEAVLPRDDGHVFERSLPLDAGDGVSRFMMGHRFQFSAPAFLVFHRLCSNKNAPSARPGRGLVIVTRCGQAGDSLESSRNRLNAVK